MPDVYDYPRPDVVLIAMRLADEVLFPTALETDGDDTVPTERLEALSIIAPPIPVQSLRQSLVASTLGKARASARPCIDRTEKRPHLAGALGSAVCQAARQTRLSAILGSTPHDRNHLGREQFQLVIAIGAGRDEVEP